MEIIPLLTLVLAAAAVALCVILLVKGPPKDRETAARIAELERRLADEMRTTRQETSAATTEALRSAAQTQSDTLRQVSERQEAHLKDLGEQLNTRQALLQRSVNDSIVGMDERLKGVSMQNEQKLENIRRTVEEKLTSLQAGNEKKLDEMRQTVDEKLQKTLDERLKQSFSLVNERLEQVHKGLGEMQTLATGVGDLKKVLSNVKTRGILGEIQLGAILEEILAPEQYATDIATVKGSANRVEYAVKMPGAAEGETVWLPIDAKFPSDAYSDLLEAYDAGDADAVKAAGAVLDSRIVLFAKEIHEKYVHVPETTEFAILFLPVEGLYAEVVRRGLVEKLQADYRVNIAGPTTMAALLNSLQMGFRTLAIQKRSGEVWKVLGEVKSEFGKFSILLNRARKNLNTATNSIDELLGTRTRAIERKLKDVTVLTTDETAPVLEEGDTMEEEEVLDLESFAE